VNAARNRRDAETVPNPFHADGEIRRRHNKMINRRTRDHVRTLVLVESVD
jgi:hypothetical protein